MISFPVKLSLCILFPSVAFAAYLVQKAIESKSEKNEDSLKSKQSLVEIKVPEECVSSIIGQHGAVIKELQRKTNTRIGFKDRQNFDQPTDPSAPNKTSENGTNKSSRLLVIRGNYLNVLRAEIEIKRLIVDSTKKLTEYFYVPHEACGRIIGRRGATIKEISNLSNCKIKLNDDPVDANDAKVKKNSLGVEKSSSEEELLTKEPYDSNDEFEMVNSLKLKRIAITGSYEQIEQAKELISNKIKEEFQFKEKAQRRNRETCN